MMDRRTVYVIVGCFLIFFGWNKYLTTKYPGYGSKRAGDSTASEPLATSPAPAGQPKDDVKAGSAEVRDQKNANTVSDGKVLGRIRPEQEIRFDSGLISFAVSSHGMGLKDIILNSYTDKEKNKIRLGLSDGERAFEMRVGHELGVLDFDLESPAEGVFLGRANLGNMEIQRELRFNRESYSFSSVVSIQKASVEVLKGVFFYLPEKITVHPSTSFLFPSYEHQDFFVSFDHNDQTVNFSAAKEDLNKKIDKASLVAVGSQYFSAALLDKSEIIPEVLLKANVALKSAVAEVAYRPVSLQDSYKIEQVIYIGPKSIDILKSADADFARVIDFGVFGVIARPLVYIMKFFHQMVSNWGFAIILLTLLVRLMVLPFNAMSMKSMKAMQKIQPLMASIREKYKDDPTRVNQEIMKVMKENKANPLSGCLPMLVQIPIFFALYRVIGSSIELYQSPFVGWIGDLSQHDRFYVLPILMGITMFVQQKITPTNMDPAQAKILAFMPLLFTFFMLQLPSGLTLYMFVSALFGIAQQTYMLRKTV